MNTKQVAIVLLATGRITSATKEITEYGSRASLAIPKYTQGEMTSQNLWSRYVRHFVGITWHNVWS